MNCIREYFLKNKEKQIDSFLKTLGFIQGSEEKALKKLIMKMIILNYLIKFSIVGKRLKKIEMKVAIILKQKNTLTMEETNLLKMLFKEIIVNRTIIIQQLNQLN